MPSPVGKTRPLTQLISIILILYLLTAKAMAVTYDYGFGEVDWAQGIIRVTGQGRAPRGVSRAQSQLLAQRAAKVNAYSMALKILAEIRLLGETTLKEFMVGDTSLVEGFIQGAQVVHINYHEFSRTAELQMILPLGGQSIPLLIEEIKRTTPLHPVLPRTVMKEPLEVPYTGVILDTRGLQIQPALFPQIFDPDGYLIYGPSLYEGTVESTTLVAYTRSLTIAREMGRAGNHPLILKAIRAKRSGIGEKTDIVLEKKDAKTLREIDLQYQVLRQKALIFIID